MGLFDLFAGPDMNVGVQEWKASKGAVLLDVRSADEYGQGHIPGSVNVPVAALVDPAAMTFRGPEEVAARYAAVGADRSKRILLYCGGGIAATLDAFLLHQLGYRDRAVYDASMTEWANDEALPIERG